MTDDLIEDVRSSLRKEFDLQLAQKLKKAEERAEAELNALRNSVQETLESSQRSLAKTSSELRETKKQENKLALELENTRALLETSLKENSDIHGELASLRETKDTGEETIKVLQEDAKSLKGSLERANIAARNMQIEHERYINERAMLSPDGGNAERLLLEARETITEKNSEIVSLKTAIQKYLEESKRKEESVAQTFNKVKANYAQKIEATENELKGTIDSLQEENVKLRKNVSSLQSAQANSDTLATRVASLEKEKEELGQQVFSLEGRLEKSTETSSGLIEQLRGQLRTAEKTSGILTMKVEDMGKVKNELEQKLTKLQAASKQQLEETRAQYEKRATVSAALIEQLRGQLESTEESSGELRAKITLLEEERYALQKEKSQLDKSSKRQLEDTRAAFEKLAAIATKESNDSIEQLRGHLKSTEDISGELRAKIDALEEERNTLQKEKSQLEKSSKKQLEDTRAAFEKLAAIATTESNELIERLKGQLESTEESSGELRAKIDALEEERNTLQKEKNELDKLGKKQLEDTRAAFEKLAAIATKESNDLIEQLRGQLKSTEETSGELRAKIDALEEERNTLQKEKNEVESSAKKQVEDFEKRTADTSNVSTALIEQLRGQLKSTEETSDELREKISSLEEERNTLQKEKSELDASSKHQLEDTRAAFEKLATSATTESNELIEQLRGHVKSIEETSGELREKISSLEEERNTLQREKGELEKSSKNQLEDTRAEFEKLAADATKDSTGLIEELHEKIRSGEEINGSLVAKLTVAEKSKKELEQRLTSVKEQSSKELEEVQAELARSINDGSNSSRKRIDVLEKQLEQARETELELKDKILRCEKEKITVQETSGIFEEEAKSCRAQLSEMNRTYHAQKETYDRRLVSLENEKRELETNVGKIKSEAQQELDAIRSQASKDKELLNEQLEGTTGEITEKVRILEKEKCELRAEVASLEEKYRKCLEKAAEDLKEAESRFKSLVEDSVCENAKVVQRLQRELESTESTSSSLEAKISRLEKEKFELRSSAEKAVSELAESQSAFEMQINEKARETAKLEERIQISVRDYEEQITNISSLRDEDHQRHEAQLADLENAFQKRLSTSRLDAQRGGSRQGSSIARQVVEERRNEDPLVDVERSTPRRHTPNDDFERLPPTTHLQSRTIDGTQGGIAALFSCLAVLALVASSAINLRDSFTSADDDSRFPLRLTASVTITQSISCVLLLLPVIRRCLSSTSTNSIEYFALQTSRIAAVVLCMTGLGLVVASLPSSEKVPPSVGAMVVILSCVSLMASFWPRLADSSAEIPHYSNYRHDIEAAPLMGQNTGQNTDDEEIGLGGYHLIEDDIPREDTATDSAANSSGRIRGTRRLLQLAAPQVLYLYAGCFVLLVRLPFSLSIPHFVSTTLAATARSDFDEARHEIFFLAVCGTIDAMLDFWCIFLFGFANQRIVRGVRLDLFAKILRQDITFFDQTSSGELASRLNSDCSEMAGDLTWFFRFSIESVVRITGITMYMLIRSPILGACALSIVPVVAAINKVYGDWLHHNAQHVQDALAEANATAQEALANVRTVIAFAAEDRECDRYAAKIERQYELNIRQLFMTGIYYMAVSTFLINTVVQSALLLIGAALIQHHNLQPEILLAFMLYQGQLQNETLNLFQSYSSLIKSSGAGDKVFSLLDRQPPPPALDSSQVRSGSPSEDGNNPDEQQPYDVEFQDLRFSYPTRPDQTVLDNLNLYIPKGKTIALVGASGCGKSTIINLLKRFYDPNHGSVLLDGVNLKELNLQYHRRQMGVVTQDPVLFSGTLRENISYGVEGVAPEEEIVRVAQMAHADEFIRQFSDGYDTAVGERGVKLSGGQRQRVSIARALMMKPSLLLLDEATSSLDSASEQAVQDALDHLLEENKTMTTVIVAHRLRTVRNADSIAVIQDGRVAEQGSHDELVAANGIYKKMLERASSSGVLPES